MTQTPEARLLVVEDDPNILELLAASLRFAGFAVDTAPDGARALEIARDQAPDLMVLDVMMPGPDGFDVRAAEQERSVLRFADIELDEDTHEVFKAGQEVSLSPTEFNLLRYFLLNPQRVLSKSQILDHVWRYDFGGDGNVVESYVSYLRRKVDTTEPRLPHTLRGVGYVLRVPPI